MIALDTTVPVWFYVMTNEGLPATGQANNITAFYTVNVGAPFNVSDTIREYDSTVLPGWYYFTHTFNRPGTHFVVFSCSGCIIQPWEDTVVPIADAVWSYGFRSLTDARIENTNFRLCYDFDLDTVASFVWNYSTMLNPASAWDTLNSRASADNITSATSTVKTYGDGHWATATGCATPSDIPSVQSIQAGLATSAELTSLQNHGDSSWATAIIPSDYAKASDIPDISGLSTFDPTIDTVLVDSTQAAGMATATGFATAADVSNAEAAILAAIPTVPTDYAKVGDTMALSSADINSIRSGLATGTDISNAQSAVINAMPDISGLSTFDAATDRVIIDATQAATMVTATGFATPNDIPTGDITAIKNKVDTLENTDLTGIATVSDISNAQSTIIEAIPVDYATSSDLTSIEALIKQLDAGVLHWATTATRLTLYKEDNSVLRVYALERDADGNITRISPVNA